MEQQLLEEFDPFTPKKVPCDVVLSGCRERESFRPGTDRSRIITRLRPDSDDTATVTICNTVACFIIDSVAEVDQQAVYPTEYTSSLSLCGLPPYKLKIKLGAPVGLMLLRNIM